MAAKPQRARPRGGEPRLDNIDINILAALQKQGCLANCELAKIVGLSASPCLARVRRLKKAGYIRSTHAHLNLAKLTDHITVFTEVTLHNHRREDFIKFETVIKRDMAVQECHLVSGGYDYLLKFIVNNVADYQELIEAILDKNIGVDKYFSYIVIKTVMVRDYVELPALMKNLRSQQI